MARVACPAHTLAWWTVRFHDATRDCYLSADGSMLGKHIACRTCTHTTFPLTRTLHFRSQRATRLISEISQLSYEERLQQCRLTTLETRRIRGDQIEVFKIMHGYEGLNKDMFFRIKNDSITRGHSLALVKSHSRLDIRKYTFSQRVVNDWNKLPEECINATSVNMFKNKIDQYYLKTRRE